MKLLAPPASYPLLAAPCYGLSPLLPLLRYVMEQDSIHLAASAAEHTADDCPFESHAHGARYHGDRCLWAQRIREQWFEQEIADLTAAALKLAGKPLV